MVLYLCSIRYGRYGGVSPLSCYIKRIYGNNVYDFCPLSVTLCSY